MSNTTDTPTPGADEKEARRAAEDETITASLAAGHSYKQAGELAGVSGKTVQRRMRDAEFASEVTRRRDERVARTTAMLTELEPRAVETLTELLDAEKPSDRLRAAQLILSTGAKRRETDDLVRRLEALESMTDSPSTTGPAW